MKGRIDHISDVVETVPYVKRDAGLRDGEDPPVIVGGALPNMTTKQLVAWLRAVAARRPGVCKPFVHFSVRVQGESYPRRKWETICERCLAKLGLDPAVHPHVAVLHRERHEENCHVVVSRVSLTGELYTPSWGVYAFIQACQEVERELGLTLTPGLWDSTAEVERPTRRASSHKVIALNRQARRLGLSPIDDGVVTDVIRDCASRATDVESFVTLARERRVDIVERFNSDGSVKGFAVKQADCDRWLSMTAMTRREFNWGKIMKVFEVNLSNGIHPERAPAMSPMQDCDAIRQKGAKKVDVPEIDESDPTHLASEGPRDAQADASREDRDHGSERSDDVAAERPESANAAALGDDEASSASRGRPRDADSPQAGDSGADSAGASKMSPLAIRAAMAERAEGYGSSRLAALGHWKRSADEVIRKWRVAVDRPLLGTLEAALDFDVVRAGEKGGSDRRDGFRERPREGFREGFGARPPAGADGSEFQVEGEFVGQEGGVLVSSSESVRAPGISREGGHRGHGRQDVGGRHFDRSDVGRSFDVQAWEIAQQTDLESDDGQIGPDNAAAPSDRRPDDLGAELHRDRTEAFVEASTVAAADDESDRRRAARDGLGDSSTRETPVEETDDRRYENEDWRDASDDQDEEDDDRGTSEFHGDPDLSGEETDGGQDAKRDEP